MSAPGAAVALVTAKAFERSKTRLSPRLDPARRAALAERLLRHVLDALRRAERFTELRVLSDDPRVAAVARALSCSVQADQGSSLGAIVDAGLAQAAAGGADRALVCMADLPRLQPAEIGQAMDALNRHDVALVADQRNAGTNLLALRLPACAATCFGHADSYARHLRAFGARGLRVTALSLPGARQDLDLPEDLDALRPQWP